MELPGFNTSVTDIHVDGLMTRVRKAGYDIKERSVRILDGYGSGANYGVHLASLVNLARGVAERVLATRNSKGVLSKPPRPEAKAFDLLKPERAALLHCMPSTTVVPRDEYPLLYSGRKRALYEGAVSSLSMEAITKADAQVKTFVKAEKINFSSKSDPAPRVIQPRSPRYNVEVGRYLKLFEKKLFESFKRVYKYSVVAKGLNADKTAVLLRENWDSFKEPVAVGLDASRFDQHVSYEALEFEHSVYNGVFNSPELRMLLKWQLVNEGIGFTNDGKVKYRVKGCRMSGDINTSMGNCLIMSCLVLAYFRSCGLQARLSNNGDDCVVICEKRDLHRMDDIGSWFSKFGFKLTIEKPVGVFEQIEFCQTQPVRVGKSWRMVRNPYTASSKDCVSLLSWEKKQDFVDWRNAIGQCGGELSKGVPFWEAYYSRLLVGQVNACSAERIRESGLGYMSKGCVEAEITQESRYSFYLAFGMLPDIQEALEQLEIDIIYAPHRPLITNKFQSTPFNNLIHHDASKRSQ